MDQYLRTIYYDPKHPASFNSPAKLYKVTQAEGKTYSFQQIQNWLAKQEAYTLHRRLNKKFERNQVVTAGIDDEWFIFPQNLMNGLRHLTFKMCKMY